ncbi:Ribonuclease H domain [Macleaya cordata]|uniref:Ribonuclease H domain n=1 Tax=Macleaya cordata TaxID=56857 RepID=A0A200QFK9_MACCD|nr:Ribonuclease H domain [Macleaya cordata]
MAPKVSQMEKLATLTPLAIIWEIWLERNRRRHDENPSSLPSVYFRVIRWIRNINPILRVNARSPSSLQSILVACCVSPITVRRKPYSCALLVAPPSKAATGGGVIRNDQGRIIAAFHSSYGQGTNNLAESRALLDGLAMCRQLGISRILVNIDSKLVVSWFQIKCQVPWTLLHWWHKIRELAEGLDIAVVHVYREINTLADFMATLGLESNIDHLFLSDFPTRLEGSLALMESGYLMSRLVRSRFVRSFYFSSSPCPLA